MSDNGHDPDLPTVSERASRAAVDGWHQRRMDDRGMGLSSLYQKIARASADIAGVVAKDKNAARGKYAPLDAIVEHVRGPLLGQGVLIRQGAEGINRIDEGAGVKNVWLPVYTDLVDSDTGMVFRTKVDIPIPKADPQAVGSAMTYGRRYTLLAALGLATGDEDDDAQRAKPGELPERAPKLTDKVTALKAEMDGIKNYDALLKWYSDPKTKKIVSSLSEDEMDLIKPHWFKRKTELAEITA